MGLQRKPGGHTETWSSVGLWSKWDGKPLDGGELGVT